MHRPAERDFEKSDLENILEQLDFIKELAVKYSSSLAWQAQDNVEEELNEIFDSLEIIKSLMGAIPSGAQKKANEFIDSIGSLTAGATSDLMETTQNMKTVAEVCGEFIKLLEG